MAQPVCFHHTQVYKSISAAESLKLKTGIQGGLGGLTPPPRGFFVVACQYMKIPADLDPKHTHPRPEPRTPPPEEFLDPPLKKMTNLQFKFIFKFVIYNYSIYVQSDIGNLNRSIIKKFCSDFKVPDYTDNQIMHIHIK